MISADELNAAFMKRIESDPNGLGQHAPGAKLDAGKNRMSLVLFGFGRALIEVGKVGTYGANKYSPGGWQHVENGQERYSDALFRHIFEHSIGIENDSDTGLDHLAHMAWNALAVLELRLRAIEAAKALPLPFPFIQPAGKQNNITCGGGK